MASLIAVPPMCFLLGMCQSWAGDLVLRRENKLSSKKSSPGRGQASPLHFQKEATGFGITKQRSATASSRPLFSGSLVVCLLLYCNLANASIPIRKMAYSNRLLREYCLSSELPVQECYTG